MCNRILFINFNNLFFNGRVSFCSLSFSSKVRGRFQCVSRLIDYAKGLSLGNVEVSSVFLVINSGWATRGLLKVQLATNKSTEVHTRIGTIASHYQGTRLSTQPLTLSVRFMP